MQSIKRRFPKLLRQSLLPVFFVVFILPAFSQVNNFPMDYQLYPRNVVTNKAHVKVSGALQQSEGFTHVRLKIYRNTILQKDKAIKILYNRNGTGFYSFNHWITAELSNYTFSLFGIKNGVEL